MIGIGGAGMRGLANLLVATGQSVWGTDANYANIKDDPTLLAYNLLPEDKSADRLLEANVVIFSDAVNTTDPLRQLAQANNLPELSYQSALGNFSSQYKTIAITGTHGKSSTTAMLAHIFMTCGLDPTALVGASVPAWDNRNSRVGHSEYFIVEADEYRRHFLTLHPAHIIITAIDFDHPDYFSSLEDVKQAYGEFIGRLPLAGTVVIPADIKTQYPDITWPQNTITVPEPAQPITLPLPGKHMQQNAALAITMAHLCGIDREQAELSLASFPGLGRRFETLGQWHNTTIISDYGHHPNEIAATMAAAREVYPQQRILALVEPHTNERINTYFDDFFAILKSAPVDGLIICPTFHAKGREATPINLAHQLYEKLHQHHTATWYLENYDQLPAILRQITPDFDIVIGFTAGILDQKLRQLI